MSVDNETVSTETGPKGLDAILSEAIESHAEEFENTSQPQLKPEGAPADEAAPDGKQPADTSRDEKGRFVSAEAKQSDGSAEAPATPAVEAPTHFTAEQKAWFVTQPAEAQTAIAQAEKTREAEYTRRSQEAADYRRTADPLVQAVTPFKDYLTQIAPTIGQTPEGMINAILQAEYRLRNGAPAEKYQAFAQLAQSYGIDPAVLAGGQIPAAQQQHTQAHPEVQQLNAKLQEMERWRSQVQEQQEQHFSQQQIAAFANEKDSAGQPKNPRFEQVKTVMASFLQSGMADNLQEAYSLAVQPYAALDQEQASRQAQTEKERLASLEKAKKAAPVKSSTGTVPRGATSPKGLDGHLSEALDKYFA